MSNSVLETWRISIERIREESEMPYQILHLSSQDIPYELIAAASREGAHKEDSEQAGDLEIQNAVLRLH